MKKRLIVFIILLAYIAILIKVMVFKDIPTIKIGQLMLNFGGTNGGHPANFTPFSTIVPYLLGRDGWIIAGINLVGNIALLIPIGFLVSFISQHMTWKKSLALGIIAGLSIEVMQSVLHVGIFDIDDVILNALGVMIGYWAFIILAKWLREKKYINVIITAVIVTIVSLGALYAIYPHGQPLMNPRINNSSGEGTISQYEDLCNGTGGTGQIISKGNNTIIIKSKAGVVQTINLTDKTIIENSAGSLFESDLKIGDHVTVIIDDSKTATTVLVCK